MLPEPKRRIRWLTREEADLLIGALPLHLAAMARFSLETGLRRANVTGPLWSQVDLTRRTAWVHADQGKARKAIGGTAECSGCDRDPGDRQALNARVQLSR